MELSKIEMAVSDIMANMAELLNSEQRKALQDCIDNAKNEIDVQKAKQRQLKAAAFALANQL